MKKNSLIAPLAGLALFTACGIPASAQIINTIAGSGTHGSAGDGSSALTAQFKYPQGVAVDGAGNVYVCDNANSKVRKISTSGIITTFAGTGVGGDTGDGGPATAAKCLPMAIAADAAGNVYIADYQNNKIRKVNTSGIITTIAGTGFGGLYGDGDGGAATAAKLNTPRGIAVDAAGNVYIAEELNHAVRKISTSGIITTIAGTGTYGYSGDGGPATAAKIDHPWGLAVDAAGNVYVSDNFSYSIRKISTSGIITTVAGIGAYSSAGNNGPATAAGLGGVAGVAVDAAGNIYMTDEVTSRIRMVNTAGIITNVAGGNGLGYSGDGGPATAAKLYSPLGVAIDAAGDLYIADTENDRIRKVTGIPTAVAQTDNTAGVLSVYPNPTDGSFTVKGKLNNKKQHTVLMDVRNATGISVYQKELAISNGLLEHQVALPASLPAGNYFLKIDDGTDRVIRLTLSGK